MIWNRPPQKDFDLIFIFVKNSQIQKTLGTQRKIPIFIGVQIQLLSVAFTLGIRIHPLGIRIYRPNFTFSLLKKLSRIRIRIQTLGIRITRSNFTSSHSKTLYGIEIRIETSGIQITRPNFIFSPLKTLSGIGIRILFTWIRIYLMDVEFLAF